MINPEYAKIQAQIELIDLLSEGRVTKKSLSEMKDQLTRKKKQFNIEIPLRTNNEIELQIKKLKVAEMGMTKKIQSTNDRREKESLGFTKEYITTAIRILEYVIMKAPLPFTDGQLSKLIR